MRRRLQKTLADYVAIAISPVLIMTLVGSLIYFLLAVSYRGAYTGRLQFIFACFVVATVLIGRIAIDQGKERAQMFAAPLAVVTFLAILKFVGAGLIPLLLIAVVWWCAHKLTWDCTLIDESEDASGEGLLQTAGLDQRAAGGAQPQAEPGQEAEEPEGVTSRDVKTLSWWDRLVKSDRRAHAPGLWVVYFSLAALPIFGLGQLFIKQDDVDKRRYVFLLLLVYVASGLGLLLTTSFLGLRRYLRQRRVQMPTAMAGVWLTIGCVLIVALLAVAAILPRPSAEYDVADLAFTVGSPDRESSRYAAGTDGAEIDKGGPRTGTRDDRQESPERSENDQRDSGSEARAKGEGEGSRRPSDRKEDDNRDEDDGSGTTSEGKEQGSGSTAEGDEEGSGAESNEDGKGSGAESKGDGKGSGAESKEDGRGSGAKSKQNGKDSGKGSKDQGRTSRSQGQEEQRDSESRSSRWGRRQEADRDTEQEQQSESETSEDGAGGEGRQPPPFRPGDALGNLAGWIARLLKWAVCAVLACVIGYWLWRRRAEWLKALANLREGWRRFWQRLLARKPSVAAEAAAAEESPVAAPRPFADFPNPFGMGAGRYSPDELVRHSFEAVEAWAREHGCPRSVEQTPHEFAQQLGTRATSLSQDVRRLADLYCRVAYSPGTLPKTSVAPLEHLWRKLREEEWLPV